MQQLLQTCQNSLEELGKLCFFPIDQDLCGPDFLFNVDQDSRLFDNMPGGDGWGRGVA